MQATGNAEDNQPRIAQRRSPGLLLIIDHQLDRRMTMSGPIPAEAEGPESTLPYPPIHDDKPYVVLSDWWVWLASI